MYTQKVDNIDNNSWLPYKVLLSTNKPTTGLKKSPKNPYISQG